MPDELLQRLRRFHDACFPAVQDQFQTLARDGQHPNIEIDAALAPGSPGGRAAPLPTGA